MSDSTNQEPTQGKAGKPASDARSLSPFQDFVMTILKAAGREDLASSDVAKETIAAKERDSLKRERLTEEIARAPSSWLDAVEEALRYGPVASTPKLKTIADQTLRELDEVNEAIAQVGRRLFVDSTFMKREPVSINGLELPDDFSILREHTIENARRSYGTFLELISDEFVHLEFGEHLAHGANMADQDYVRFILRAYLFQNGVIRRNCPRCGRPEWVVEYKPPKTGGRRRLTETFCPVCAEAIRLEQNTARTLRSRAKKENRQHQQEIR